MKFLTVNHHGLEKYGVLVNNDTSFLPLKEAAEKKYGENRLPDTLIASIASSEELLNEAKHLSEWAETNSAAAELVLPLDAVEILAPIPRPSKNVFCVGKNYAKHAIEMGSAADIPEDIIVFTKSPTAVTGSDMEVLNHSKLTSQLDYEGELAVVIGKKGKGISEEDALDYVFGYTIVNDITARDLQSKHKQYFIGKSLDTSCPMGPWIVDSATIDNPNSLTIQTKVNGELRQDSNTQQFIFPVEKVIAILSQGMTLEPGDIIATGTPAGVGKGFKPPRFLKPGDEIEISVENIGTLTNRLEA
ncbi:fumarylacetoacetate hydrolase family protein [Cytobacillus purgationiresistens]|uniref:2-keto-4-pentenoate hydratase/2-oxohepta-3-ene-1,7-dioic acid hydratase in catechol pathway n=1 Tax=Cytobacillus purgationiresistens TaxID=863449 RepID=A0ABU0AEB0_9BACI|nr:fumarylacetoacetate hydrolase family protein [Cytobacillus purgationiresistens]MDQ0268788.1 2-keto-4-pentenoate hydratase/2-oxohepta-3-ene-1,7-dioic acid hydratase in catechol pathway [Cytobacillus purgationiresistens]